MIPTFTRELGRIRITPEMQKSRASPTLNPGDRSGLFSESIDDRLSDLLDRGRDDVVAIRLCLDLYLLRQGG